MQEDSKMKIGIATFQKVNNYGAVLQAYALSQALSHMTKEPVFVVNYKREQDDEQYAPWCNLNQIMENPKFNIIRYLKFASFRNRYLPLTKQLSSKNYFKYMSDFDIGIWGSDQIWNKQHCAKSDETFFFAHHIPVKKIAYAPSMGGCSENAYSSQNIADLKNFDKLTARDTKTQKNLKKLTGKAVPIVPDPVFLLSETKWKNLIQNRREKNTSEYILLYEVYRDTQAYRIAKRASDKWGLPLKVISYYSIYDDDQTQMLNNCGPIEFLEYIYYAKYVFTNSFHASAFSIIFQKDFYTIIRTMGQNDVRKQDLLNEFGLNSRLVKKSYEIDHIEPVIDYTVTEKLCKEKRNYGLRYLHDAIHDLTARKSNIKRT